MSEDPKLPPSTADGNNGASPEAHDATATATATAIDDDAAAAAAADNDAASAQVYVVKVEAFGSGALLHRDLPVPLHDTVRTLRQRVRSTVQCPPRTRVLRLFAGHGGVELDDDANLVVDTPLALAAEDVDVGGTPLVVFPTPCTSARAAPGS